MGPMGPMPTHPLAGPPGPQPGSAGPDSGGKRSICFDYCKGQCLRGDTCKYSHDIGTILGQVREGRGGTRNRRRLEPSDDVSLSARGWGGVGPAPSCPLSPALAGSDAEPEPEGHLL